MIWKFLEDFRVEDGTYLLSDLDQGFEDSYLKTRGQEQRIMTDDIVLQLPYIPKTHPRYVEWRKRAHTLRKLVKFFSARGGSSILDLGCGNGWLINQLAQQWRGPLPQFLGLDVNQLELKQAAKLFNSESTKFAYGDLFTVDFPKASFDHVLLNASLQYFDDLDVLLQRLSSLLMPNGLIHLLDSPLYSADAVEIARKNSIAYYKSINCPEMVDYYHHHTWSALDGSNHQVPYQPNSLWNSLLSRLNIYRSPFPWIIIQSA